MKAHCVRQDFLRWLCHHLPQAFRFLLRCRLSTISPLSSACVSLEQANTRHTTKGVLPRNPLSSTIPARICHQKHRATSLFIVLRVPSPGGGALPL